MKIISKILDHLLFFLLNLRCHQEHQTQWPIMEEVTLDRIQKHGHIWHRSVDLWSAESRVKKWTVEDYTRTKTSDLFNYSFIWFILYWNYAMIWSGGSYSGKDTEIRTHLKDFPWNLIDSMQGFLQSKYSAKHRQRTST